MVSKMSMDGQPSKYEILCPPKLIHHHLVCLKCGRVQEIDADVIKEMQDKIDILKKFKVADKPKRFLGIVVIVEKIIITKKHKCYKYKIYKK